MTPEREIAELRNEVCALRLTIDAIVLVLDGREWDSGTSAEIANILHEQGLVIRDPSTYAEDMARPDAVLENFERKERGR